MIAPLPAIAAHPDRIKRQDVVVLTQTIVTPDSTRTAIITLGNGGHTDAGPAATGAPNPPPSTGSSSGPSKDSGLSPTQIGIILGCCIGALVLLLILWFCLSRARFIRERIARDEDMRSWPSSSYTYPPTDQGSDDGLQPMDPALPRRRGWPSWRSVPPPVVPIYHARHPSRQWRPSVQARTTQRPG